MFPKAVLFRVPHVDSDISKPLSFFRGDLGTLVTLFGVHFYNPLSCLCAQCGRLALERDLESGLTAPALPTPPSSALSSDSPQMFKHLGGSVSS